MVINMKKTNMIFIGIAISVILLVYVATSVNSTNNNIKGINVKIIEIENQLSNTKPTNEVIEKVKPTTAIVEFSELIDDDSIKGETDAPVTIIEFSDYECPYCARFFDQTYEQIDKEYIQTGKVKLVFRDYPLKFHKNAQKAAEAAECAGEQDKYYQMHDKLFDEGVTGGVSSYKKFADEIGLDTTKFNSCLDNGDMAQEVKNDMSDGIAAGVTGTPGFLINGKLVSGAQPFSVFKQIIESELGG